MADNLLGPAELSASIGLQVRPLPLCLRVGIKAFTYRGEQNSPTAIDGLNVFTFCPDDSATFAQQALS